MTAERRGWPPAEHLPGPPPGPPGPPPGPPVGGYPPPSGTGWAGQPGYDRGPQQPSGERPPRWMDRPQQWQQEPPPPPATEQPPPAGPYDEPTVEERTWVDLRLQIASRLRGVNAKHCHEAYDRLGKRNALGPHGVVLFYTAPERGMPYGYRLLIATRLFLAGPESDDLSRVLQDLTRTAAGNIARFGNRGQRWDPRGPEGAMVNGGDLDMPHDAVYVGVGVSTLDTDEGPWHTIANSVRRQPLHTPRPRSVFDLAGQGIALLSDGTALRMVRDPNRRIGDDGITSNKSLDASRRWPYNPYADLTEQGDQNLRAAWTNLAALHRTLAGHLLGGRPA